MRKRSIFDRIDLIKKELATRPNWAHPAPKRRRPLGWFAVGLCCGIALGVVGLMFGLRLLLAPDEDEVALVAADLD